MKYALCEFVHKIITGNKVLPQSKISEELSRNLAKIILDIVLCETIEYPARSSLHTLIYPSHLLSVVSKRIYVSDFSLAQIKWVNESVRVFDTTRIATTM